jgi:pimeloyl-ACP methyl ester carboxylesterase
VLVLLKGGAGDAEGLDGVATRLLDRFTVVTYDRRGLSRSTLDDPAAVPTIRTHGDDVDRLLAALTAEPALVAGFSFGALVGLDLLARHPERVRRLLTHEAPTPQLLPEPERSHTRQRQRGVEDAFAREGPLAAMQTFAALGGLDFADREPGVEFPRPSAQYGAKIRFFLTHDAPAAHAYDLDRAALEPTAARIIVAAGSTNRDQPTHRCAEALAAALGTPFVEFPGGTTAS